MKYYFLLLVLLNVKASLAQTEMKSVTGGSCFTISVPQYMNRTIDLNDDAILQYKSTAKDVYTIVIEDNFEELAVAEIYYSSLAEFVENTKKKFLKDKTEKKFSETVYKKVGKYNFGVFEASYVDQEDHTEIHYVFGFVETKTAYYKILSWSEAANKDLFKEDFLKILYSFKE